jgi:hypothetical protein
MAMENPTSMICPIDTSKYKKDYTGGTRNTYGILRESPQISSGS